MAFGYVDQWLTSPIILVGLPCFVVYYFIFCSSSYLINIGVLITNLLRARMALLNILGFNVIFNHSSLPRWDCNV